MKHYIFMVYDTKGEAFLPPFFLPTRGMAMRAFSDACNDKNHNFGAHPEDYTLFNVGTWDVQSGAFAISAAPEAMANGLTVVKSEPSEVRLKSNGAVPGSLPEVAKVVHE